MKKRSPWGNRLACSLSSANEENEQADYDGNRDGAVYLDIGLQSVDAGIAVGQGNAGALDAGHHIQGNPRQFIFRQPAVYCVAHPLIYLLQFLGSELPRLD